MTTSSSRSGSNRNATPKGVAAGETTHGTHVKEVRPSGARTQEHATTDDRLELAEAGQPVMDASHPSRSSGQSFNKKNPDLTVDTSGKKSGLTTDTPETQPATFVFSGTPEFKERKNKSRSLCCLLSCLGPYKGPFICILIVYVLLVSGGASYLFKRVLEVPGLRDEVSRLQNEVTRLEDVVTDLEGQVSRLEGEVDRFGEENTRLEKNNDEYEGLNEQLKSSNEYYDTMNQQLNVSNQEYRSLNYKLELENNEYDRLNKVLNSTVRRLNSELTKLQSLREDLASTIQSHEALNDEMAAEVSHLEVQNGDLNRTVNVLSGEVSDLQKLTEEYKELNANLNTVVSFLDDVGGKVDQSFEGLVAFLTDMIVVYRQTAVENMHFMMETKVDSWRCRLDDAFVEDWVVDTTAPIGADSYPQLLDFLEEEVLSEVCADRGDFENYLASRFVQLAEPSNISLGKLASAVTRYVSLLKDHYFPDENENGITEEEWEDSGFKCSNLPAERRFKFAA